MQKSAKLSLGFSALFFLVALLLPVHSLLADEDESRLSSVLQALRATDSKEQNLFCKGRCHLAKFSHRFTSVDIENLGARTLIDVLSMFPGLVVSKDYLGRPTIGMYGLSGTNRMQILVDGIRQNDPFDGAAILSLPAQVIDFIDVYYGPGGTWFGEGSLSGVIDVNTKKLPEIRQFSYADSNAGLGSGLYAIYKHNQFKAGLFGSFSVVKPIYDPRDVFFDQSIFQSNHDDFRAKNLWASGFVDARISNSAQAHLVARTSVAQEFLDPMVSPQSRLSQSKLSLFADIHLLKKRAQKNAMDLFLTTSYFEGFNQLEGLHPTHKTESPLLDEKYRALRLELGTRFHLKPWYDHDLFFGIGAYIHGVTNGTHTLYDLSNTSKEPEHIPFNFDKYARIFGRPSALFQSASGHAYGFIQDEWQIKAPVLVVMGTRVVLPIESPNFSAEFTPNIGAVLTPMSKIRIKVAFHTALRAPTAHELSDRRLDQIASKSTLFDPSTLTFERADSIEASIWYGEQLGTTHIKNSLTAHFSEVDEAIIYRPKSPLSNRNELNIFGIRSMSEATFDGGHAFSLGIFYSLVYRRDFDEQGYPTCKAGLLNPFSSKPVCPHEEAVPRISIRASLFVDLLSIGSVNLASSFIGNSQIADLIREPTLLFHITYQSKPMWRYLVFYFSLKGFIGGVPFYEKRPDHALSRHFYEGGTVLTGGVNVSL